MPTRSPPSLSGTAREAIAGSRHLRFLPRDVRAALAAAARPERHAAGATLTREGEAARRLCLVVTGEVVVSTGEGRFRDVVHHDGPGALFGAGPVNDDLEASTVTALSDVTAFVWDAAALRPLFAAHEDLRTALATALSAQRRRPELVSFLRRSPCFRLTSPALTRWLLDGATLTHHRRGATICCQGDAAEALFVVVSGEVAIVRREPDGSERLLDVRHPGDVFGERALLDRTPQGASAVATRDAVLLVVGEDEFRGLCRDSASFRHMVSAVAHERAGAGEDTAPAADVVLFVNRSGLDTARAASLVAQWLSAEHRDATALVTVVDPGMARGAQRSPANGAHEPGGVPRYTLPAAGEGSLHDAATLAHLSQSADVLLCFAADRAGEQRNAEALVDSASSIVFLVDDASEPFPYAHHTRKPVRHVYVGERRAGGAPTDRRAALRLRFDPGPLPAHLSALSAAGRAAVGRLARAVTQREVGIALGGGAGWGWAHVPLLVGLHEIGVPVDLVAGVSFGAVVGACYASQGTLGLDRLVAQRRLIAASTLVSGFTMWPSARFFDHFLPHRHIEDLPVQFYALAVDILSGEEKVFRRGNVGDAIRASCSLPGVVAPAVFEGRRYVDGCVKNNVPVSTLLEEGADFVIASNVVPAPAALPIEPHHNVLQRAMSALSPLRRARDAMRAYYIQAHGLGDRGHFADIEFEPDLSPFPLPDYARARDIIEHARRQLPPVLDEIGARYRTLARAGGAARRRATPEIRIARSEDAAVPPPPSLPRPEIRRETPPSPLLRGYLGSLRLAARWFRYECEGWEHIVHCPTALLVGYHGRPFAWDLALLSTRMYDELGYYPRTFTSKGVRNIPFYRGVAEEYGALYEEPDDEDLARMRAAGHHIAVCPGGLREAVRPFWIRYRVDFGKRRGYLRFALERGLSILPIVADGVDDAYLGLNDGYWMSNLLFGNGYYSAWAGLGLGGFYPLALPFPVKIRQRVGPPIDLAALRAAHPGADLPEFLEIANGVVTGTMQRMLDELRGKRPQSDRNTS